MDKTERIYKVIFFVLVAYMVVWFWPVFFHHTLFYDKNEWADCYYNEHCNSYYTPTPVPSGPTYAPSYPTEPATSEDGPININIVPVDDTDASEPVACTMDAKVCADGSAVGRVAPDCEFAKCPEDK